MGDLCCMGDRVGGLETACLADDIGLAGAGSLLGCDPDGGKGRWYALYVRSRHERVVESGLRGKGYPAFSPFYRMKRKRVDRSAELFFLLFPGYFFSHFDSNKRLLILMTPGMVRIVGQGNRPEPVD